MQSLELRRAHKEGTPFQDTYATLHQPQSVPPMLLLSVLNPTPLQQQVYKGFLTAASDPMHSGTTGPVSVFELRLKAWLSKLKAFTDAHPAAAYHNLTDDPALSALVDEVMALAKEVNDPLAIQGIALQLFQCAAVACPRLLPQQCLMSLQPL
jgi:hypothetical protein